MMAADATTGTHHFANDGCFRQCFGEPSGFPRSADEHHAKAHVEDAVHLTRLDIAPFLHQIEDGRNRPAGALNIDRQPSWQYPRYVADDSATGDVGDAFERREQRLEFAVVAEVGFEQDVSQSAPQRGVIYSQSLRGIAKKTSSQRVAISVQAAGRQTEHDVALDDVRAHDDFAFLDHTDDTADQVIVVALIDFGHLGYFAPDESAVCLATSFRQAFDDGFDRFRHHLADADIVEKEEGLSAARQDVVDTMIHDVLADGVMLAHGEGNLDLGADPIHAGDEYGLLVAFELVHASEEPNAAQYLRAESGPRQFSDIGNHSGLAGDVNSGACVGLPVSDSFPRSSLVRCFLHFSIPNAYRDTREMDVCLVPGSTTGSSPCPPPATCSHRYEG